MDSNKIMIPVSILVAGLLIAGAVFLGKGKAPDIQQAKNTQQQSERNIELPPITAADHIYGDPNAPIKIVEYSDLECPACKMFQETMNQVVEKYVKTGKVAWVYRHYPLYKAPEGYQAPHPKAGKEAEATECAAELGGNEAFFKMADKIYSVTPSNNGLDLSTLPALAKQIGLDQTKFKACLDSNKYASKIEADYNAGAAAGVQATPSFVFVTKNGNITQVGGVPFESLQPIIENLLKQ